MSGKPVIFAFWHGRMLIMPPVYHKVCGKEGKDAWIMVSRHWDGELIARTVAPFRILSARGSSTRGGREALHELVEKARLGHTIGITPDGPGGPRYTVQPGVVRIAQLTGTPIIPLTWGARPRWVASSWDRFQIPMPFARVSVIFDEPFYVPEGGGYEDLEPSRVRLEERLGLVTDRMEDEAKEAYDQGLPSRLRATWRRVGSRFQATLRTALQEFWAPPPSRHGAGLILSLLLAPLSCLYHFIVRARRDLYRKGAFAQGRAASPVVSVGGVRVGGSGKTPFTLWMARRLVDRGCRVALLTRGYGRRRKKGTILLTPDALDEWSPLDCGDEPYLLAQSLPGVPVAVDGDRTRAAKRASQAFSPDLFLMDDGFQHLRLARDFDVVLVPRDEDLSDTACLPKGPLREPLSALKDADVVVLLSPDGEPGGDQAASESPWWRGRDLDVPVHRARLVPAGLHRLEDKGRVDPQELAGRRGAAFCGIARPDAFWRTLEGIGLEVDCRMDFPDHHPYSKEDHQTLMELVTTSDFVVTTEKDAVKIAGYPWPAGKILFLRLDLVLEDEVAFWERLEKRVPKLRRGSVKGGKGA
jgi:tetraacyldisaccharide 4'-kinase